MRATRLSTIDTFCITLQLTEEITGNLNEQLKSGRMLAVLVLGFSSGLPLFILLYLLQAWLAKSGLNVKALGLFALVQFPYIWKFLWASFMDRYSFGSLGRRRGWMALTQAALFLAIGGMGMLDPHTQVPLIVAAAAGPASRSCSGP